LVDDDDLVSKAAARILVRAGHQVSLAATGADAIAAFEAASPPFDLVIIDEKLPDMRGAALVRERGLAD
jgi:two-component system, cell cycle response regulator CpdR